MIINPVRWNPIAGYVAQSYPAVTFGLHPGATTKACVDNLSSQVAGTIRLHDAGVAWKFIEAKPGVYSWASLDGHISRASGRQVIYTIFGTPQFHSARPNEIGAYGTSWPGASAEPANDASFVAFVSALVSRYKGRIHAYEVGNEAVFDKAGNPTGLMFTGTATAKAKCVRLAAQVIKSIDPTAKILSTPVPHAATTDSFKAMMNADDGAGGTMKQWCDVVAYHAYGDTTPDSYAAVSAMRYAAGAVGMPDAELWDTESNVVSTTSKAWTDAQCMAWMKRHYVLSLWAGVKRTCLYGWDQSAFGIRNRPNLQQARNSWLNWIMANGIQDVARDSQGRVVYCSGTIAEVV